MSDQPTIQDPIKVMETLVKRIKGIAARPRILVVEDELDYVSLLQNWFTGLSYDLHFCHTGEEAIKRLYLDKYNLVWLDLKLPGVSGVEVLKHCQNLDTIVVTGYPDSDLAREAFKLGTGLVYRKPDNLQELKRFLQTFNLNG